MDLCTCPHTNVHAHGCAQAAQIKEQVAEIERGKAELAQSKAELASKQHAIDMLHDAQARARAHKLA